MVHGGAISIPVGFLCSDRLSLPSKQLECSQTCYNATADEPMRRQSSFQNSHSQSLGGIEKLWPLHLSQWCSFLKFLSFCRVKGQKHSSFANQCVLFLHPNARPMPHPIATLQVDLSRLKTSDKTSVMLDGIEKNTSVCSLVFSQAKERTHLSYKIIN